MRLAVIIPAYISSYEHLEGLLLCINSLQTFASRTIDITFYCQDDASPLVHLPMLLPPCSVSTARNEQNLGFAGNCNAGAARADGHDVYLFMNQDVFALPQSRNWDVAIMQSFVDNPGVGIVGAKLLFPDGRLQSAGGLFDGHKQPFHRWLGYTNHELTEYNTPGLVSWTTGAALAIHSGVFKRVGGMDTAYIGGYFEDVDLCCKVREAGFSILYQPAAVFVHHVGTTGGSPTFMQNMQLWKTRWVESGKVSADTMSVKEGWW